MNTLKTYRNVPIIFKNNLRKYNTMDVIFQNPLYGILESFDYTFELLIKDIGLELIDIVYGTALSNKGDAVLNILDTNAGKKIYNKIQNNKYGALVFKCFELNNHKLLISSFNLVLGKTQKEILEKMPKPDKRKIFNLKG